ncbi:MAG: response regulator [Planctomycetes bacterium]|nr:response regulator [Planctomycetota bacterium]
MANEQILIVDDDKDLVTTLATVLESAGYRVSSAANGTEGWKKAQESRPDLAIIDVIMDTVGEGVRLTHRFRSDDKLRSVPIIMLTGVKKKMRMDLRPLDEEGYLYLPVDKYMDKPVDPQALLREVAGLL